MIKDLFNKVVGSRNDRQLRKMRRIVGKANEFEAAISALGDADLRARTDIFRSRVEQGESLESILPEAFAVVRETSRRVLEMRHFDVQLIGGIALHEGHIAEMRTGEGKTLAATLPAYLNALDGRGVHVVTVNDYLARRDGEWMGAIYDFLGLRTGVVVPGMAAQDKREAYAADIVYATNNELGFDYLRDNMAFSDADKMQRTLNFAIVDEVDSILIDEARTPLIISGPTDENSDLYQRIDRVIPQLKRQREEDGPGDYSVDEKAKQVHITEEGHEKVESLLIDAGILTEGESLYDSANIALVHHLNAGLRAHALYNRNVEYIVRDRQIVIVDEFTGRTMPGRRWSEGLHQAIEAKEGVPIQNENQTLASITFQNYFRQYEKLAGMTGTADTEAAEFQQIYNLEVVIIPTHQPMIRDDMADLVFLTQQEKFEAVLEDIRDCAARGQPVLVGTTSIETSELLAGMMKEAGIAHEVLNAKQHQREAAIVAQAGRPGAVTIATNMAGRGTDIVLGGNPTAEIAELPEDADEADRKAVQERCKLLQKEVIKAGGLHIIGTERHDSRRIDNQLRGRSGRQGDPGSSRFYLSLKDDLMRRFASERVAGLMQKMGMEQGEAIEHKWVSRAIENAQRKVEAHNFDIRKQLLEYDDVANDQRKEIYTLRNELMAVEDVSDQIKTMREDVVQKVISTYIPPESLDEQWDIDGLEEALEREFALSIPVRRWLDEDEHLYEEPLRRRILETIVERYREKEGLAGARVMRHFEKAVTLQILDRCWKEHLASMDYLRQGIGLRGYAQKNPKQEYKREAFEMFHALTERLKTEIVSLLSKVQVRAEEDVKAVEAQRRRQAPVEYLRPSLSSAESNAEAPASAAASPAAGLRHRPPALAGAGLPPAATGDREATMTEGAGTFVRESRKIGRNEPCPCGSGKKYKRCCGRPSA
ncbi:MAG: preprotein translocase subunit SecA [Ectothiorhodospiraceae bacterium AqS1]|nr:preprotein translocase subunit SecA [Ectothiorhodospiraceae bacterium AqS1]